MEHQINKQIIETEMGRNIQIGIGTKTPWTGIKKFKKGSLLSITLSLNCPKGIDGKNKIEQNIIGICTKKVYKGYNSKIWIKHLVSGETIIQEIPLYSPFLNKIEILKD